MKIYHNVFVQVLDEIPQYLLANLELSKIHTEPGLSISALN
jgi:hypothetical protein